MIYELEPFKNFILASEVKVDLWGQRTYFKVVEQFYGKPCCKGLIKISGMVYELEPFKDFILASEVKVDLRGQISFGQKLCF